MRRLCLVLKRGIFSRVSTPLMSAACAMLVCAVLYPTQGWAQWAQLQELTAPDGATYDEFGYSVAVSGNTAVVGAPCHLASGPVQNLVCGPGAAYVFVQSGGTWTLQAELTASDGAAEDRFGYTVAVSGNTVVVGAFGHTAAYVFVQSGGTWTQQAELTASDGVSGDLFGGAVAVSGGTVVVGAFGHNVGSNTQQGAAYVFVQSGGTWTQQAELTASDGAAYDEFGARVTIDASTVVVGAPTRTVGPNFNQGTAYVFVQSGGTWTQQAELTASDGATYSDFGHVTISSGTIVAGAPGLTVGSNANQGAAYAFVQSGGTWTQQAELTASNGAVADEFGAAVAISGSTIVVGADQAPVVDPGKAYVFAQNAGTWTQQAELTASDGAVEDDFGNGVAVSGSTAVVGAYCHPASVSPGAGGLVVTCGPGAAYVFIQPVVTFSGSPQQPLTTDSNGNFVANVTITNTGNVTVSTLQVNSATLGSGSLLSAPAAITNLAPGAGAVVTLTFPPNSVPSGATTAPLKLNGAYSVTSPALNGNWALSFRSVTL